MVGFVMAKVNNKTDTLTEINFVYNATFTNVSINQKSSFFTERIHNKYAETFSGKITRQNSNCLTE